MTDIIIIKNIEDIKNIFKKIKTSIFFIATNADRGVGLEKIIPNFHIICIDYDDEVEYLEKQGVKIFCFEKETGIKNILFRNSALLLKEPQVLEYIRKNSSESLPPAVIFFKPSVAGEKTAREHNWRILNNSAELTSTLEDKLNFALIARLLNIKIPDVEILDLARVSYWELKKFYDHFVIQLKKGFAGNSTFFVQKKDDYAEFMQKYYFKRKKNQSMPVKISKFIKGTSATINACICSEKVYIGTPCFQITGEKTCTKNKGATCGNDWFNFSDEANKKIFEVVSTVGKYLINRKYQGIFGLDLIISERNKEIYLIEINPRLVASIPFYTKLEIMNNTVPLLALHILDFLEINFEMQINETPKENLKIKGAQMIIHNIGNKTRIVNEKLKAGIYRFHNKKLIFQREGYSIEDISNNNEFIILPASRGRILKPETDLARLQFLSPLLEKNHRLGKKNNILANKIYKKLKLKSL